MNLSLFLNAAEPDPRLALVVSQSDMTKRPMPVLTFADFLSLRITLCDGAGGVHAASGGTGYTAYLALGLPGHDAFVEVTSFVVVATPAGWTCTADLDVDALALFIRSAVRPILTLLFRTSHATDGQNTWLAAEVTIADAISAVATPAAPAASDDNSVQKFMLTVTTHAAMRALDVAAYASPKPFVFLIADQMESWVLRAKAVSGEDDDDVSFIQSSDSTRVFVKAGIA